MAIDDPYFAHTGCKSARDAEASVAPGRDDDRPPSSSLATLLDRFTASLEEPEAHTIGSFAETVQALHAEFAMLARHFGAVAERAAETAPRIDCPESFDLDDVFPVVASDGRTVG